MRTAVIATALAAALAAGSLGAAPASAAVIWDPVDPVGGCGVLSCAAFTPGAYGRTLSAAELTGVSRISAFLLDRAALHDRTGVVFRLAFYAGDKKVGDFGKFMIDMLGGDQVLLSGPGFDYDPSWGDLSVRVEIEGGFMLRPEYAGMMTSGGGGFGGGLAAPAPSDDGDGSVVESFTSGDDVGGRFEQPALVTEVITAVPEPASWAMMILGFLTSGALIRARRRLERAPARR